ncbi:MAG: two-component sensor histidine kinase [Rhodospirillales bacterium RIFCSPLOWO2_12_FULL_58_28]|nr:MAG: two-component sensor histidine kinase [Rhodospirillales bacterium RIFCSPLOWO2_02_FULL_58_16]OHC79684.1 MAG: two-component sensor histidine kinase [Rhodospirillales bacterium RIFCSPLOWO2_12_FULL_58_28]
MTEENIVKRLLPHTLLGRSLIIIITPLVILQVVAALIFFENHWDKVSLSLARGLAGDIASVVDLMRLNPQPEDRFRIFEIADIHMSLSVSLNEGGILPNTPLIAAGRQDELLIKAVNEAINKPFLIDTQSMERDVRVDIQLTEGVLRIVTPRKRLFSSTTYVFVMWMVGTSMILFGVATIFMRNQVKPIRRLALAADDFGMGRDTLNFKPEGASEVRQAAFAFIAMRERIMRHIAQRTEMLAGVSHDLRTPLTRMKLQLEMSGDGEGIADLKQDVVEMEHMLGGYLDFARGEGEEQPTPTDIAALLGDVAAQARRNGGAVDLHAEGEIAAPLRKSAFRRCVTNLVDNALRYADHVTVRAGRRGDAIEIVVDDDGPGIPENMREDVFRPFFRLEGSRNPATGGVGLGLTIARDVVRAHGGDIELMESPNGGLRVKLRLPL